MESARQRLYRTEGIVIRRIDLGEADKILSLYTPQRGKLRVVAKGVRRPESHLGGHVELFMRATVLIARGRNLDIVTQAETLDAYKGLRTDLTRMQAAFYFAELLDGLVPEEQANEAVYRLLVECLSAVAAGGDAEVVTRYYESRLLALVGYGLELRQCLHCQRELAPVTNLFSAEAGGALCPDCRSGAPDAVELSVNALKVLRYIMREPLPALLRYRLTPALRDELKTIGYASIRQRLEHPPRTWALLASSSEPVVPSG